MQRGDLLVKHTPRAKEEVIFMTIFIACIMFAMGGLTGTHMKLQGCETCEMRFPDKNITAINGVYHHPDYFCVWTKTQTAKEAGGTYIHEICHIFEMEQPEHFCEFYYKQQEETT